jgi:hypothetical protein
MASFDAEAKAEGDKVEEVEEPPNSSSVGYKVIAVRGVYPVTSVVSRSAA